MTMLNID